MRTQINFKLKITLMINPIDNDIYINYKNKSADMKMCHKDTVIMALCYKSLSATL